MLALLVILWARLTAGPSEVLVEEAPTIAGYLGKAWPFVRGALGGLLNFLTNQAQNASIDSLQAQVDALAFTFQAAMNAFVYTDDREAKAMVTFSEEVRNAAGTLRITAANQQAMWSRLRYTIMPNTIQNIYTVVFRNYVRPLRKGLDDTLTFLVTWLEFIDKYLTDDRNYTRTVQTVGRNWRAKWVYPQLNFLLSPWRVAFYYQQPISVAVARHILKPENAQTRDTISRVIWDNMDNLWQSFDKALAAWLQTDISAYGWGADVPTFPRSAEQAPPKLPPGNWEPWQRAPSEHRPANYRPVIPNVDYSLGQ